MIRVLYSELKSKRQLIPINLQDVCSAGFQNEDNKEFVITFQTSGGLIDLMIAFHQRTPRVYVSKPYQNENNWEKFLLNTLENGHSEEELKIVRAELEKVRSKKE